MPCCVQVVVVTSACSPEYSSMLRHMAAVKLIGVDVECSVNEHSQHIPVLLAFMVPAAPASPDSPGELCCRRTVDEGLAAAAQLCGVHSTAQHGKG